MHSRGRPEQAVLIIQRFTRGMFARRRVDAMRAERADRCRKAILPSWDIVSAKMEEFSSLLFRRVFEINPAIAKMFPYARDEDLRCAVSSIFFRSLLCVSCHPYYDHRLQCIFEGRATVSNLHNISHIILMSI